MLSYNEHIKSTGLTATPTCNMSAFSFSEQAQIEIAKEKVLAADEQQLKDEVDATRLGIPVERLHEMQAYAMKLHRKYPDWKKTRLQRKTAEHFKIKLT